MRRLPSLTDYDRSPDASPRARQARAALRKPPTAPWSPLGTFGCWCGGEMGHGWRGKADGAPHPRDWPGRVNGHPYREAS